MNAKIGDVLLLIRGIEKGMTGLTDDEATRGPSEMNSYVADVARRYVRTSFPDAAAVFLSGSGLTGGWRPGSDIDILIVTPPGRAPGGGLVEFSGELIDVVAADHSRLKFLMEFKDKMTGLPTYTARLGRGFPLIDTANAAELLASGVRAYDEGPFAWGSRETDRQRFLVTSLLSKLVRKNERDRFFYAAALYHEVFVLCCRARGKWVLTGRLLPDAGLEVENRYQALTLAFASFRHEGSLDEVVAVVNAELAPVGGPLSVGFWEDMPAFAPSSLRRFGEKAGLGAILGAAR